jgi:predicted transcriptional regulator
MTCNHGTYFGDWCEQCVDDDRMERQKIKYVAELIRKPATSLIKRHLRERRQLDKRQEKEYKLLERQFKKESLFYRAFISLEKENQND